MKKYMLVAVIAAVAASACNYVPPPPQNISSPWVLETDSIGFQYVLGGGAEQWPGATFNSTMGATINVCPYINCVNPTTDMNNKVNAGVLPKVFIELGNNDVYADGGWTQLDVDRWTAALTALPSSTCIVLDLPWVGPQSFPINQTEIQKARDFMVWASSILPNIHTIDWGNYAQAPGVLGPDGLHLAVNDPSAPNMFVVPITDEARAAFNQMLTDGSALCP